MLDRGRVDLVSSLALCADSNPASLPLDPNPTGSPGGCALVTSAQSSRHTV